MANRGVGWLAATFSLFVVLPRSFAEAPKRNPGNSGKATPVVPTGQQPPSPVAKSENAWSIGISDENKAKARALLAEGNTAYLEDRFLPALEKYQAAIALWAHPAIELNAVRALVRIERPVDADAMLTNALRYQAAPFTAELFAEAQTYQALLKGLVATVRVTCAQPATVSFDNAAVACPGTKKIRVNPGRYTLAATLRGFVSVTRTEILLPGENPEIKLQLQTFASATVTKTRWATWKPWAVAGTGVVIAGVGVGFGFSARSNHAAYDKAVGAECGARSCALGATNTNDQPRLSSAAASLNASWQFQQTAAISLIAVGGAAVATGVTMLVLNRPSIVIDSSDDKSASVHFSIDPVNQGVLATGTF